MARRPKVHPSVRKLAQQSSELATRAVELDREAEQRAAAMALGDWPRRRALLIINSKSGPHGDSLLRLRELVDLLSLFNIRADVRVKLRKKQARREARLAARAGCDVVIAAGGDGTVEAVASGLMGTSTPLGIIPLGTYNNLATCLGIPSDAREACALIAAGSPRALDAAVVRAHGMKKPRAFFETCAIGVGAAIASAGQDFEKGRWQDAARSLSPALAMSPVLTRLDVDDEPPQWTHTLLITVSNAPRAGAALQLAPDARMDDGALDLTVFDELQQAELAARLPALASGNLHPVDDPRVQHRRCAKLQVRSTRPLPVAADSRLLGTTPVQIRVKPGGRAGVRGTRAGAGASTLESSPRDRGRDCAGRCPTAS